MKRPMLWQGATAQSAASEPGPHYGPEEATFVFTVSFNSYLLTFNCMCVERRAQQSPATAGENLQTFLGL